MRTIVKILSVAVAAACAVGMSACGSKDGQDASGPASGAGAPTSQASGGSTDSAAQATGQSAVAGAQEIEPITFTDETIGLTQTCDQMISDFATPTYKAQASEANDTVYLLHCTLDFSDDFSFTSEADNTLNLIDENDTYHFVVLMQDNLKDDMTQAGLHPITSDDHGASHVDGWYGFVAMGDSTQAKPLPEDAMTLSYDREAATGDGDDKGYEVHTSRSKVTVKNG